MTFQKIFISLVMVLLSLPALFMIIPGDWSGSSLSGVTREGEARKTRLISDILAGKWQERTQERLNSALPFRNYMIQAFNTLDFYLFRHSYMAGGNLFVESGNWLYERFYFDSIVKNVYSNERLIETARRIKKVSDTLEKKYGKKFILVSTAGKAITYPEHVRDEYQPLIASKGDAEYRAMAEAVRREAIPFVDGQEISRLIKRSGTATFSSVGAHWNGYAAWHVMDAILEEAGLPHAKLPPPVISGKKQTATDTDLLELANIFGWAHPRDLSFVTMDTASDREGFSPTDLSLQIIGGSFCWTLFDYELKWCPVFSRVDVDFYYALGRKEAVRRDDFAALMKKREPYEKVSYCTVTDKGEKGSLGEIMDDSAWRDELLSHDIVVLEFNGQMLLKHIDMFLTRAERVL